MERESSGVPESASTPVEDEGLKPNAIGFIDGLSIGLASTAPAYPRGGIIAAMTAICGLLFWLFTGQTWLGVGPPLVIGVGFLLLGFILTMLWRLFGHTNYFRRKGLEKVHPGVAAGHIRVQAEEI
jgi:hypothetical protein